MPTINPVAFFLLGPIAAVFIWVLAAFPAYPKSVKAKFTWLAQLALVSAGVCSHFLFPNPIQFRATPGTSSLVITFLLYLPFAASFLLWRSRRNGGSRISGQTSTLFVIAVCVFSFTAVKQFNKTCVHHDYWHDDGEAWCADSWQANW
jgi:hypothetical protein